MGIGDFDPKVFPIPNELHDEIQAAYSAGETNYPAANGIAELRDSVAEFIREKQGLDYSANEYLIAGGARPLIYATYQAIVNNNEKVLFPVPSWNNNHYTHLAKAQQLFVETKAQNNFMPSADEIKPHLKDVAL